MALIEMGNLECGIIFFKWHSISALKCYLLMLKPLKKSHYYLMLTSLKQTITILGHIKHHDSRIGMDTGLDVCPKLYSLVSNSVGSRIGGWFSLLSYLGIPILALGAKKLELDLLGEVGTWNVSPL